MRNADAPGPLRDLAFLYLAMAYQPDRALSAEESDAILAHLHTHFPAHDPASLQRMLAELVASFADIGDVQHAAMRSMMQLRDVLTPAERASVLANLEHVGGLQGAILEGERGLLNALALGWDAPVASDANSSTEVRAGRPSTGDSWGVLHDLALIYLVLAQGTDDALSSEEMRVILNKLQEWHPETSEAQVRSVLNEALQQYAYGPDEDVLNASIAAVREALPENQRMAVLNDLIQIANADGLFLDDEEDLINNLMDAWNVAAYANYGPHGTKRTLQS